METPLTLDFFSVEYTNTTIYEMNTMEVVTSPETSAYTGYQVIVPKSTRIISNSWATELGYASLTENTTHYIMKMNGQMVDNTIKIKSKNTPNTQDQGTITVILKNGNYDVQKVSIIHPENDPITLGIICSSSERETGAITDLTCEVDRNNEGHYNEDMLEFVLPA